MKHVHTCLNAREDRESSFHRSGSPDDVDASM